MSQKENISVSKAKTPNIKKGIQKLEEFGKRGKLHKIITITVQHFEFLKNSLDEYSLRILAYIIKGFFLSLNKSYLSFIRDNEKFIEVNIHGGSRGTLKKETILNEAIENIEKTQKEFTLQNLSLFSENTFFEKFLENSNMTKQIQQTLKRINKNFSTTDFEILTDEEKKEYLKKHFIKPFAESLPLNADFFVSNSGDGGDGLFSNYINVEINEDVNQVFSGKQTQSFLIGDINNFGTSLLESEDNEKIILVDINAPSKNNLIKRDRELEINLPEYLIMINEKLDEGDTEEVFFKNIKAILKTFSIDKFKNESLVKQTDNFESKEYNSYIKDFSFENLFPNAVETISSYHQLRGSLGGSNSVFSVNLSQGRGQALEIDDFDKEIKDFNYDENLLLKEKSDVPKELISNRQDVQNEINNFLSNLNNYREISAEQLLRKIDINCLREMNTKEKASVIFYNMLIVCQNNKHQLKQSEPFEKFFLYK